MISINCIQLCPNWALHLDFMPQQTPKNKALFCDTDGVTEA